MIYQRILTANNIKYKNVPQEDDNKHLYLINVINSGQYVPSTELFSIKYAYKFYTIMLEHGFSHDIFNDVTKDFNCVSGKYGAITRNGSLVKMPDHTITGVFNDLFFRNLTLNYTTRCSFIVDGTLQHLRPRALEKSTNGQPDASETS